MQNPTQGDKKFINKAAMVFAALLNESDKYTRDPNLDGFIANLELDARTDEQILRITYVFEGVPRVRQYWKAFLNEEVPTIYKDEDSEYDSAQDRSMIYNVSDLIPTITRRAFEIIN